MIFIGERYSPLKLIAFKAIFLLWSIAAAFYSSKLDRYYVGHTEDIDLRIIQHNTGISTFTSNLMIGFLFTNKYLKQERLPGAEKLKSKKRKAGNILNG